MLISIILICIPIIILSGDQAWMLFGLELCDDSNCRVPIQDADAATIVGAACSEQCAVHEIDRFFHEKCLFRIGRGVLRSFFLHSYPFFGAHRMSPVHAYNLSYNSLVKNLAKSIALQRLLRNLGN